MDKEDKTTLIVAAAAGLATLAVILGAKQQGPPQGDQRGGSLDLFITAVPLVGQLGFKSDRRTQ